MALNIVVCVKSVMLNVLPGKNRRASENMELNPFDRPVLKLAISLTKKHHGKVTVLSMGPKNATFGLHQALSMGADRAILICDPALKESDTYVTAKVLGTAIKRMGPFDLVLFGTRSSDSDTGHVGPQTAEMLNLPFIGNAHQLTFGAMKEEKGDEQTGLSEKKSFSLTVERNMDNYQECYALKSPAVFSIDSLSTGDDALELTTLYGIEEAFDQKGIEWLNNDALGLAPEETGLLASPTKIVAWHKEKKGKACQFIEGAPEQKAEQLVDKLVESGFVG